MEIAITKLLCLRPTDAHADYVKMMPRHAPAANLRASVVDSIDLLFDAQRYAFSIRLSDAHDAPLLAGHVGEGTPHEQRLE